MTSRLSSSVRREPASPSNNHLVVREWSVTLDVGGLYSILKGKGVNIQCRSVMIGINFHVFTESFSSTLTNVSRLSTTIRIIEQKHNM